MRTKKLGLYQSLFLKFLIAFTTAFLFPTVAVAQSAPWTVPDTAKNCLGFLCGAVYVITANAPFDNTAATAIITMAAVGLNGYIAFVLGGKGLETWHNHQEGQEWRKPLLVIVTSMIVFAAINYVIGRFMGIGT